MTLWERIESVADVRLLDEIRITDARGRERHAGMFMAYRVAVETSDGEWICTPLVPREEAVSRIGKRHAASIVVHEARRAGPTLRPFLKAIER